MEGLWRQIVAGTHLPLQDPNLVLPRIFLQFLQLYNNTATAHFDLIVFKMTSFVKYSIIQFYSNHKYLKNMTHLPRAYPLPDMRWFRAELNTPPTVARFVI